MTPASKKKTTAKKSTGKKVIKKKVTSKKADGTRKKVIKKKMTTKKAVSASKNVIKKKVTGKKAVSARKAPAKKVASKTNKSARPEMLSVKIAPEQRWRLIATAAYLKAEKRGFASGGELQDWIEAEKEIDQLMSA